SSTTVVRHPRWASRRSGRFCCSSCKSVGCDRSFNVYAGALKFLYGVTLDRPEAIVRISRLRVQMHVPVVLTAVEVQRLLSALGSDKVCLRQFGVARIGTDAAPIPTAFVAAIVTLYAIPVVNEAIVQVIAVVVVHVRVGCAAALAEAV